jgi:carbon-monoxide dehydrogenase large subunit
MIAIAAHTLEAAPADMIVADGRVHVAGTPTRGLTVAELARKAYFDPWSLPPGEEPGLEAQRRYTPASPVTWSNATCAGARSIAPRARCRSSATS